MTTDGEHSTARRPSVFHRWREGIARYRALHITWQITVLTIGTAIICAGLAMLVLPGPGVGSDLRRPGGSQHRVHVGAAAACLGQAARQASGRTARSTLDTVAATRRFSRSSSSSP